MDALVEEAWHLYHQSEHNGYVVSPSIPILYFGDHERYIQSPLKVVTVGLNPSKAEFPHEDPFSRFRPAQHVYPDILTGQHYAKYADALNNYFRSDPYRRWFNSFEPILNGMNGSYYAGQPNTVLHTDLCSPLATDPTWSGLADAGIKRSMEQDGRRLWIRLVRHLAPDVVIISVARRYLLTLDEGHFPHVGDWEVIYTIERANPYRVQARAVEIVRGTRTLLVFGAASQTPFGKASNPAKVEIGRCIEERVRGR